MIQLTENIIKNWLDKGLYTYDGLEETLSVMIVKKLSEIKSLEKRYGDGVRPSFVSTEIVCLHGSIHNYEKALQILKGIEK